MNTDTRARLARARDALVVIGGLALALMLVAGTIRVVAAGIIWAAR